MGRAIERFEFDSASPGDEDRRVSIDSSPSSAESTFRELDDVFLQTQARIWLGEVLHTRLDEETPIADLLADGKLLFQLSKVIWKMLLIECVNLRYSRAYFSESKASGMSSWKYMAYSNVDSFLKICQILGLTSIDLFSSSDVVEKRNTRRVCMCIRLFSMKARSRDLNVPDFDGVTYGISMPTDMVGCIRRSLEKPQDIFRKSSDFCDPFKVGPRYRQRSWDVGDAKCYDSCSEEFQDPGNNYQELGFDSPSSSTSHDGASLLVSDAENSPNGSLMFTENLIMTCSALQSIVQDQEKGGSYSSQNEPTSLAEWSPSTCSVSNDNHQVPIDVMNKVSDCLLDRRSSDDTEFAITHPTTSQNSIACRVVTVDYEDKFEAHGYLSSSSILVRQAQDLDSVCTDMSLIRGFESEDMVNCGVYLDSSNSDIDKLQSETKTEDIDMTNYLPSVECQMKELSIDVTPLSTCSEHVHRPPVPFSEFTHCHWVSGSNHAKACNTEVAFNVLCGMPTIKEGEKCIDHATSGNDPMQSSCRDTSKCSCVWCGNTFEDTTFQQSFIRGHPTALYENRSFANYLVQCQAISHSVLDIPEDKHVLPSSIYIQPSESVCIVLADTDADSGCPSSVKTLVGYQVTQESGVDASEEKTQPPLSANIEFKESDCLLADHLEGETEKGQSDNGSVVHSVALERADAPDISVCISYEDSLSDANLSVNDDKDGIQFMSISTRVDESGDPSLYLEHDNVEACICQNPVAKNVLPVTTQGVMDLKEAAIAVGNIEKDEEKVGKAESCNVTKEPKPHKRVLLKSVAGGVTLIGVFFFLFNRRRKRGNGDAYRTSPLSIQVRKGDQAELPKPNGQKKGRINGVYPGGKLKFQD